MMHALLFQGFLQAFIWEQYVCINVVRNYHINPKYCLLSWIIPFVLCTISGRSTIHLENVKNYNASRSKKVFVFVLTIKPIKLTHLNNIL